MNQSAGAAVPGHILFCGGITKATWSDVNPLAAQENGKHTRLTSMLHASGVLPDITHADNGQFLNVPFLPRLQGRRTGSPGGALGWVWEERPGSLPRRGSGRGRLRTNNFFCITQWRRDHFPVDSLGARRRRPSASPRRNCVWKFSSRKNGTY